MPTMSSVSQPSIMSAEGLVPSRPIEPVTKGRSSGSAARPLSALATPAPSRSATSIDLVGRALRALADEHRHLVARVERLGGAAQVLVARADDRGVIGRRPA